ncbi:MAG: cobalt transporter CbiM [Acidobacteria bacterium]|nr:MAG: cobalt transporter CbiM [Acidobacteriota bacterium]
MHIPDGYLGPPTYLATFAACVPLWRLAARKVGASLSPRRVPLLALASAYAFVIMMFNIPLPGGSTGHAVGGVLIAILIGPWAAALAVSIAVVIQALLFGDGGVTAIGANCLNIAFVMPFTGYAAYAALSRLAPTARWRAVAAGIGGWVGLTAAAFTASVMFGLQPLLHTAADGRALYAPYPLAVAVPVMLLQHLLVFGVVEGLLTGLVLAHLPATLLAGPLGPATESAP